MIFKRDHSRLSHGWAGWMGGGVPAWLPPVVMPRVQGGGGHPPRAVKKECLTETMKPASIPPLLPLHGPHAQCISRIEHQAFGLRFRPWGEAKRLGWPQSRGCGDRGSLAGPRAPVPGGRSDRGLWGPPHGGGVWVGGGMRAKEGRGGCQRGRGRTGGGGGKRKGETRAIIPGKTEGRTLGFGFDRYESIIVSHCHCDCVCIKLSLYFVIKMC